MSTKVVVLNGDDEIIEEFSVPEFISGESIEYAWFCKQVEKSLENLEQWKEISSYEHELLDNIVEDLLDNHESIEQDIDWRVRDYLGLEG